MAALKELWARLLNLDHPTVPRAHVALTRLLALCWVVTGHIGYVRAVRLPWVPIPQALASAWPFLPVAIGVPSALAILFSTAVRKGALGLGLSILVALAGARAEFAYNRLFVAALLIMVALAHRAPLPRWQVAVLYLGAGLDKWGEADWRSGQTLEALVKGLAEFGRLWGPGGHVGAPNAIAQALATAPHAVFWAGSWAVIALELALAFGFALGRRWALAPHLAFHVALALLTGGTFGMFFFAALASSVLVLPEDVPRWPAQLGGALALAGPWFHPGLVAAFGLVLIAVATNARALRTGS